MSLWWPLLRLQSWCPIFNSLWPSDAVWCHRTWPTLVQIMTCCLMTPSRYLKQCCNHQWGLVAFTWEDFHRKCWGYLSFIWVWKLLIKVTAATPRDQWIQSSHSSAANRNVCVSNLLHIFRFPALEGEEGLKRHGLNMWRLMSVFVA